MPSVMHCVICGAHIGFMGWAKHIEKHKREFCKVCGVDPKYYSDVLWQDVKDYYGVEEKTKERVIELRPTANEYLTKQLKLKEFIIGDKK